MKVVPVLAAVPTAVSITVVATTVTIPVLVLILLGVPIAAVINFDLTYMIPFELLP